MNSFVPSQWWKKLRFARSFLANGLVHVNLQILYTCNFRCRICDFWTAAYRDKPQLSPADAAVISAKLNQIGPQIVSIGGGEPMLHPGLAEIVRALGENHFPVMITNGWFVTPERARTLWQAGLVEISVSVDYADPGRHDAQRGVPGAHAQAVQALRALQEYRTHPAQRVNMISVIMDDNLAEVGQLIEVCQELGVTYLVTLYSQSRGSKAARVSAGDASTRLLELKRRNDRFVALRGYLERFSEAIEDGGVGPCSAGQNLCNIDSQGNVTLCIDRLDEPVGNILHDDAFDIVGRLAQRQQTNSCRDCWTSCRGSIEAIRHGRRRLLNVLDYWQMTKPVALGGRF